MLTGKSPFKAATDYLIFQKIKNLEYAIPDEVSEVGKDIIERLLQSEPEKRLGSAATGGIQAIKDHAFFEGVDWKNIFSSNAPSLRERLEKEVKANPVIPPAFDFEQSDNEAEDVWFGKNAAPLMGHTAVPVAQHQDPFNDNAHIMNDEVPRQSVFDAPPTSTSIVIPPSTQFSEPADRHKSYINHHSPGLEHHSHSHLKEDSMKRASQLSSAAPSTHSIPERSNGQPHPLW